MIKPAGSKIIPRELMRRAIRAMPKSVQEPRLHAAFLGQRMRVAFKPKHNPRKPSGDVWVCMEFDFKERHATVHKGRVPESEARKWVDSLARRHLSRDDRVI